MGLGSFIDSLTGKKAEDEANAAINSSTERTRGESLRAIEAAGIESKIGTGRASFLLGMGTTDASKFLTDAEARTINELQSGFGGARGDLRTQEQIQQDRLQQAQIGAINPLEAYTTKGLNEFQAGNIIAANELTQGGLSASGSVQGGFGSAQSLGQPLIQAGNQGIAGLQQIAGGDNPYLKAQLARATEGVDADLARRGLFGSTGGAEVAAEARRKVEEANYLHKINAINNLSGIGVNAIGNQQNLLTQEGLTESQIAFTPIPDKLLIALIFCK